MVEETISLYQVNIFVAFKVGALSKSCGLELGSGRESDLSCSVEIKQQWMRLASQNSEDLKSILGHKYKGMQYKKNDNNMVTGLLNLETPFRPSVFLSSPINFLLWERDCQSNFIAEALTFIWTQEVDGSFLLMDGMDGNPRITYIHILGNGLFAQHVMPHSCT